ncbi:prolyl oligopeptidase family serine peptidase [Microbacterium sp. P02]|uniref:dipeptidyl-peptidase 5 n=1 Tax=unclassified Microbacterium TaxID=2609290 RepID=UPI0036712F97
MNAPSAYGSWPSPISARIVAAGSHPVTDARYVGDAIWWLERMPAESGRSTVRRTAADGGEPETMLPRPWDVRSRVHEYGGAAWTATADGTLYFVESTDQRVWVQTPGEQPAPLTPAALGMRFADLAVQHGELLAVRETDGASRAPRRDIVSIPLDGSARDDETAIMSLVSGSDFAAYPRVSPDGERLAWIAWDHPRMPWDGTELRIGDRDAHGRVSDVRTILGGPEESVVQPEWIDERELRVASDRSGRWNLYRVDVTTQDEGPVAVAPVDADTGGPLWNLGIRWFAPLGDGRVLTVRTNGSDELALIEVDGTVRDIPTDVSSRLLLHDVRGARVLFTGSGVSTLGGLWEIDLDDATPSASLVRGTVDAAPDAAWLSRSRAMTFEGPHGPVHAFAYAPVNPDQPAADGAPPYLVLAHGGPTSNVSGGASLDIAYFTSRGIGVLDVNYGGSTGYGRAYRERLSGQWGIVDRDDVVAAAEGLVEAGLADGSRLAIRGGSAGGWTVLCALTATDRFAAGVSRYGVADLRALAEDTHDFEARYLDGLVGPYPQDEAVYVERSPLSHLDRFTTPMLIEQGLDDPVVPPTQSEAVRDALAARGIPHAYLAFEGESHGFRRPETVIACLEAEVSFFGQVFGFTPADVPTLTLE